MTYTITYKKKTASLHLFFFAGYWKLSLLDYLHQAFAENLVVVIPSSNKYQDRYLGFKNVLEDRSIMYFESSQDDLLENLMRFGVQDIENKVLLSAGYPFILKKEVFGAFDLAFNLHPSLLPENRGKYLHYILINNEAKSGVTAHIIDEGVDSGSIIYRSEFTVSSFDTTRSLQRKSDALEPELVHKIIADYEAGALNVTVQDEA